MAEWTPAEDATLHRMWMVEGHSAGFIATAMNGRSRNAVIGRAFRMGWARAEPANAGQRLAYPGTRSAAAIQRKAGRGNSPGSRASLAIGPQRKTREAAFVEPPPTNIPSPDAKPWTERLTGQCAYPVDGEGADVRSCCNPTDGGTYCSPHSRVMYAPSTKLNTYGIEVGGRKSRAKAGISDSIFAKWAA